MPMLTAVENVALPLVFRGEERQKREKAARSMLKKVGLKGYENRLPSQMSGGQQQRIGIARALVINPKIIFADEPTGNLDSHTTTEVMELMVDMVKRGEQTMILVTHDRSIASYADRIITIQDGSIIDIKENN